METALSDMSQGFLNGRRHRQFNNILTLIVAVVALYIILGPFLPAVTWQARGGAPKHVPKTVSAPASVPIPSDNELIIPRLGMEQTINTGPTQAELSKGPWLIPNTSTPDKNSNTVIAGHRFTYAGPAVFYFLDKVQLHDTVIVNWQHKQYTYQVNEIKVVPPTDVSVQSATKNSQLTVYTCAPLLTAKNRLVIIAPLESVRS
jgi:LPXTG-site transpeptidase (sortase) family protein